MRTRRRTLYGRVAVATKKAYDILRAKYPP